MVRYLHWQVTLSDFILWRANIRCEILFVLVCVKTQAAFTVSSRALLGLSSEYRRIFSPKISLRVSVVLYYIL